MNKRVNKEDYETPPICKKNIWNKGDAFFIESEVQREYKKKKKKKSQYSICRNSSLEWKFSKIIW